MTATATYDPRVPLATLRSVGMLASTVAGARLRWSVDGRRFDLEDEYGTTTTGGLADEDRMVVLDVVLGRVSRECQLPVALVDGCFLRVGDRARITSVDVGATEIEVRGSLQIASAPLGVARSSAVAAELRALHQSARKFRSDTAALRAAVDLDARYKPHAKWLEPVRSAATTRDRTVSEWAERVADTLLSGVCVAVVAPAAVIADLLAAEVASVCQARGSTLGRPRNGSVLARELPGMAMDAPGPIVIPADHIAVGSNSYELSHEVRAALSSLESRGRGLLFTGTRDQLGAVFHGGQGGAPDPLSPLVVDAPALRPATLVEHAVDDASRAFGGSSAERLRDATSQVVVALTDIDPADRPRLVAPLARRAIRGGVDHADAVAVEFAHRLHGATDTLGGLAPRLRAARTERVEAALVERLTSPGLRARLGEHLVAQDAALDAIVSRLRAEILTRPAHQPVRWCAQGTPGTGKSESARLVAGWLGVPHVNVDAASMSDPHTASAQLLGSGRGIVGSQRAGRLEEAARSPAGVLIEVSDLDHAHANVRSFLADLFLQVLETGEAQAATGAMFSCASVVFAFTLNLPGGADMAAHRSLGFGDAPSSSQVTTRVSEELSRLLSGAFVSRVGDPIVFAPLDRAAVATLVERTVAAALRDACARLGLREITVELESGLGATILSRGDLPRVALGMRALVERMRGEAADALLASRPTWPPTPRRMHASCGTDRPLVVEAEGDAHA